MRSENVSVSLWARRPMVAKVAAVAGAVALIGGCSYESLAQGQIVGKFPADTAVGQTRPVTVRLVNTSTDVSGGAKTVTQVRVLPSCAGPVDLGDDPSGPFVLVCPAADVGVFSLAPDPSTPLTGDCGTATGFTVGAPDGQGIVPLTPTPPNSLIVPAASGTCVVHLRQTTVRLPSVDVDPATAGTQTFTGVGVTALEFGGELDAFGTPATVTVRPQPTTPTPTPAPARAGGRGAPDSSCGAITDRPSC